MPNETLWESVKKRFRQEIATFRLFSSSLRPRWPGSETVPGAASESIRPGSKFKGTDGTATGTEHALATASGTVDEAAADTEDRFASSHREARSLKRTLLMVSDSLERAQIADYVQLLNTPKRLIYLNLLAGLFRGVGMAIGFTLLTAMIIYILTRSFVANLPVIGDFLGELVWIIQQYLRGKS